MYKRQSHTLHIEESVSDNPIRNNAPLLGLSDVILSTPYKIAKNIETLRKIRPIFVRI